MKSWKKQVPCLIHCFIILSDCSAPFQVNFVSNAAAADTTTTTAAQRGFCLEYKQIAC